MEGSAINFIDYELLEQAQRDYAARAAELEDIAKRIIGMNQSLMNGWKNDTARGFAERLGSDHIPKLQAASVALQDVSNYIRDYVREQKELDRTGRINLTHF